MSSLKFKELKGVADDVRFKDKYKHQLSEFQEEIRKLEDAILEADKRRYDAAIKHIRQLIGNRTHGVRFKEFDEKLKELESKVRKGAGFLSVTIETKTDESGAVGGRKQSKESGPMECGTDKRVDGRIKSDDSSSSLYGRQGTERKGTKAETPRDLGSVKEGIDNDECRIEIEKLNEKLENAWKYNCIQEKTDKKSSISGTNEKRSPIKQQFDRVNEHADRIIAHLELKRDMSYVKGKTQDKLVKNAIEKVESEAKARMEKVITCLEKLKEQIDANKVDVQEFQKLEGSQEEKQVKACLEDICVKVINIRDTGKGKTVDRGAKLQQQVDELWNLTFDPKSNTKGSKGDEDNLLNMLEKITPEIKKRKDLQTAMEMEIKALNDDVANFDDPIEPSFAKVSPKHPGILNHILNARKQLSSKKIKVAKQIIDSHKKQYMKDDALNEMLECQKRLLKEIEELKKENDVLLTRLSKMDGANSTLSALSDPYRATRLAEQFSELYDNSWTDAFEVLEIPDEKECIHYLLNIVVESYSICADISRKQQIALATALQRPTEGLANKTLRHDSSVNLLELQSTFSDLRKASAVFSVDDVKSYFAAKNVNWVEKSKIRQFTLSCIELCWFMHLQSPPVYVDVIFVTGSTFDTNKYKPYTKCGEQIDFIVFPSLLLHKGGPLLCKGVAQGK